MLNVDQAVETILSHINRLGEEERPLLDSLGQIAAEDVTAEINVADWDSATQDGFAVLTGDIRGAGMQQPRILKVIDKVVAGSIAGRRVIAGTAVRIMTGAQLPPGADCVVRFEDTDEETRRLNNTETNRLEIGIQVEGYAGQNIRRAGEMVAKGALVLEKGAAIGPAELGVLASLGYPDVRVIRRPVVAIIPSGEELVNPGEPLYNPQIYNSGSYAVAAQVKRSSGLPWILPIARDNNASIAQRIRQGMEADALITCGGSSAGDYDLVKEVMAEMGEIIFEKVNMSPGKPFSFGLIKNTPGEGRTIPHFALTGNPSAGMINFEVLVRPAILKMQGRTNLFPEMIEATLLDSFENKKGARCFIWAQINREGNAYSAGISRTPAKGILPSISAANGLVIIPEDRTGVEKGEKVQAILLDWF